MVFQCLENEKSTQLVLAQRFVLRDCTCTSLFRVALLYQKVKIVRKVKKLQETKLRTKGENVLGIETILERFAKCLQAFRKVISVKN